MPLGNASPSATCRAVPSGVTSTTTPGVTLAGHHVEAAAVDVGVAAAVDDDLVPAAGPSLTEIGVGHQRAIGLPAQQRRRSCETSSRPSGSQSKQNGNDEPR